MKMITIALAALSLNNAFACEPYAAIGAGPIFMIPNATLGVRFDDEIGKVDLSLSYSHDSMIRITQLMAAKLFFTQSGLYAGPSYSLCFHRVKLFGTHKGNSCLLGIVTGKDFNDSFIQMDMNKRVKFSGEKFEDYSVKFKFGVKF